MHKIKIINILQGKVFNKNNSYSIGFVTSYGTAIVNWNSLPEFLSNNNHLENVLRSSIIESTDLIGKYIFVRNKKQKYTTNYNGETHVEYRIRVL
jgi:hypothetical protein